MILSLPPALYCLYPVKPVWRSSWRLLALILAILLPACGRGRGRAQEIAYVSAPQAILRDHVSAVFNKTGVVKNGDRVQILERARRFARVRTAGGAGGWRAHRALLPQSVYDGFQKRPREEQNVPVQATGTTR